MDCQLVHFMQFETVVSKEIYSCAERCAMQCIFKLNIMFRTNYKSVKWFGLCRSWACVCIYQCPTTKLMTNYHTAWVFAYSVSDFPKYVNTLICLVIDIQLQPSRRLMNTSVEWEAIISSREHQSSSGIAVLPLYLSINLRKTKPSLSWPHCLSYTMTFCLTLWRRSRISSNLLLGIDTDIVSESKV